MTTALLNFYNQHVNAWMANILSLATIILLLIFLAWIMGIVIKQYLAFFSRRILKNSHSDFYKSLAQHNVFQSLFHIGSGTIFYCISSFVLIDNSNYPHFEMWLKRFSLIYIIFGVLWFLRKLTRAINSYYQSLDHSGNHPINTYLEAMNIVAWVVGGILAIAILIDQSPWALLTGLGAISAVILLIFKDSITGLVSSIEAYIYQIAKVGDTITIPNLNVDGKIELVTVNTVKVRNGDNTIVSFPTSSLISGSVQNWRGMVESKGRRIKKSVLIDVNSIKFCDSALLEKISRLKGMSEISQSLNAHPTSNLSLYRNYLEFYLREHPGIHHTDFDLLIRDLDMTSSGLPVEIYAFTNDTAWKRYEAIQAGIIEHALAILPEFELRAYQK